VAPGLCWPRTIQGGDGELGLPCPAQPSGVGAPIVWMRALAALTQRGRHGAHRRYLHHLSGNGDLLRRGEGQHRWHSLVNCNHGGASSSRFRLTTSSGCSRIAAMAVEIAPDAPGVTMRLTIGRSNQRPERGEAGRAGRPALMRCCAARRALVTHGTRPAPWPSARPAEPAPRSPRPAGR
jgi:hypothetical protein